MDKFKSSGLQVPQGFSRQLGEFSSRTVPITNRIPIESQIPKSGYLIKALYFISQISIPILWNLFVIIFISPILFLIRLCLGKKTQAFHETYRLSNFLSFNLFCPLLIYKCFWPNKKDRSFYLLILAMFELLTYDEVWQINQIIMNNQYKIQGCLNFIIFKLIELDYISLDEAESLKKSISFIFTDYDLNRMIRYFVCLVVNKNSRLRHFPQFEIDDKNLRRVYKNKLHVHLKN